jgi:hypothetical protein
MRKYLLGLAERNKWLYGKKKLNMGDIVIIIDPDTPRGKWPIARVVEVFTGQDGVLRFAIFRLRSSTNITELPRLAVKLCLLESWDAEDASAFERRASNELDPVTPPFLKCQQRLPFPPYHARCWIGGGGRKSKWRKKNYRPI